MARSLSAFRVVAFTYVGCAIWVLVSCGGEMRALEDPAASKSGSIVPSPESQGSAVLEVLREAGGPGLTQTEALRDAWGRLQRAAPAESAAFGAAFGALQVAAPDGFPDFLRLFLVAAAEEWMTDEEKDAIEAASPALMASVEEATAAVKAAVERRNAAFAAIAASPTGAGMRTALVEAEEAQQAVEAATAEGLAASGRLAMVAVVIADALEEMLSKYAGEVATEAPTEYATFVAAVEQAEAADPDAWEEFVRVGALFVLAPTEAWR